MLSMDTLEALSTKHRRKHRCKVAEALVEYSDRGQDEDRARVEEAIDNPKISDDAVRLGMRSDGIEAFADAAGPQSVTFHRLRRCVCFRDTAQ